jgi:hypothetical protein
LTVGTSSGADIILSKTKINTGDVVVITAATVTGR